MSVSNTMFVRFLDCKMVTFVTSLCSGQILYPPRSRTIAAGVAGGSYSDLLSSIFLLLLMKISHNHSVDQMVSFKKEIYRNLVALDGNHLIFTPLYTHT